MRPFSILFIALVLATYVVQAQQIIHVNCGGLAIGNDIVSDKPEFRNRTTGSVSAFGSGTATTYQSTAWATGGSDLVYALPAPVGENVKVKVQFAELWRGAFTVGVRRMRVSVNGAVVENDLDVFARAGRNTPFDVTSNTLVPSDGFVEVRLEALAQNVMICGILIEDETTGSTPTPTSTPAPTPASVPVTPAASVSASTSVVPTNSNLQLVARSAGADIPDKRVQLNPDFLVCPDDISTAGISIECVAPNAVGSVQFLVNGAVTRSEGVAPYTIAGDSNGVANAWTVPTTTVTIECRTTNLGSLSVTGLFSCSSSPAASQGAAPSSAASQSVAPPSGASQSAAPSPTQTPSVSVMTSSPSSSATDQSQSVPFKVNVGGGALSGGITADSPQYRSGPVGTFQINGNGSHFSHAYAFNGADLVYTFPVSVPSGTTVQVAAEFGEIFVGAQTVGARRMRVSINGVVVETNLDVFARVGANQPLLVTRTFELTSSEVVIRVEALVENAMLSGATITAALAGQTQFPTPTLSATPSNTPSTPATGNVPPTNLQFSPVNVTGNLPPARHENGAVFCNDSLYLIGGRGLRGFWAFKNRSWLQRTSPGIELHHFQAVCVKNKIYVAGAWNGSFPNEEPRVNMSVYDTAADSWNMDLPNPSGERLRGSAAVGVFGTFIIMAAGSSGGHGASTILKPYTDVMDTAAANPTWVPWNDMLDPRDHTGGAVVEDQFCVAGGRNGSAPNFNFWRENTPPINCINITQGPSAQWRRMIDLPEPRGGVAVGATCDGYLVVAGGEARNDTFEGAYNRVDLFDPVNNEMLETPVRLNQARHGTGLGVTDCPDRKIYITAGSGTLGGSEELNDVEVWSPAATETTTTPASPVPTTPTSPTTPIPVDAQYCITMLAEEHVNPRPAAWVLNGTSLTSWPDDGRPGQIETDTTVARLEYNFTVPIESVYAMVMDSTTFDMTEHNDGWCGLENEPIRLVQYNDEGVLTGDSVRTTMQKAYQNTAKRAKAMFSIDNNGHTFTTANKLKPDVTYKLLFAGRSTQFTLNGLIMFPCDGVQCWRWNSYHVQYLNTCNV